MRRLFLPCALAILAHCTHAPPPAPAENHAELVLRGGTVLTQDPQRPVVHALAVGGGRVMRAGEAADVQPFIGPRTEVVELGDRTAVPGFIDCHTHVGIEAFPSKQVWHLDPTREELLQKLRSRLGDEPDLPLLLSGWIPMHVTVTRADLDALGTTRPILVMAADGHAFALSSAAMTWLGIGAAGSNEPSVGADRDATGALDGVFRGMAWSRWIRGRAIERSSPAGLEASVRRELAQLPATGVTAVHNMSFSWPVVRSLAALADRGELPVRVRELAYGPDDQMVAAARALSPAHRDLFRIAGYKYFLDGGPFSGNGAYLDAAHSGPLYLSAADFGRRVAEHARRGESVAVHASGQLAVRAALDAFASAGTAVRTLRFRIEHADVVAPDDENRLAEIGPVLSMQPAHFPGPHGILRDASLMPPAAEWGLARHLRRGLRVCLGSDSPAPPLASMAMAMAGPSAGEGVSFEEALAASTRVAAWAAHDEDELGTLSEGKRADLVILARDPRSVPPAALPGIAIERTLVGGRTTYDGRSSP